LSELLPFSSHFHGAPGRRQHYLDEGQGEVVVMLHGNPTWCYYYRNLVERLSQRYRCIVPDHLGCGLSDAPSEADYGYSLNERVDDLESLIEAQAPESKITLVLHDWGGMIGMAYAHRHPERIARFVVLNTAGFRLPSDQALPRPIAFMRSRLGRWLIDSHSLFARSASYLAFCRPVSGEIRRAYRAPYEPRHRRVATRRFVEDIPLTKSDPSYAIVAAVEAGLEQFCDRPALIAWGLKDFVFTERFLAKWQRHWPHAEVQRFPDCGHYVLEDAGPPLIDRIDEFLARHDD
jgi:pimeloyl-ACP methyl ester carboxylesterase